MHRGPEEIRLGLGRIALRLLGFRRTGAEHRRDVEPDILEFDIGHREGTDIAAGAGERDPRRGVGLAALVDHLRGEIGLRLPRKCGERIRPIGEGGHAVGRPVRIEIAQAVADRYAEFVAIDAGQRGQDIDRGMRDQRRVVIGEERAVALQEIEQVWHLLEVGGDIRVVAPQMDIVELDMDDVLDLIAQ
jgi:hypothetical protein